MLIFLQGLKTFRQLIRRTGGKYIHYIIIVTFPIYHISMIAGEYMSMLLNIYCRLFSSSEKNIDKITSFRFLKILIDCKHRVPL